MGYRLNRLDEPIFMAVPKPMLTEFGIHYILESCGSHLKTIKLEPTSIKHKYPDKEEALKIIESFTVILKCWTYQCSSTYSDE